MTSAIHWLRLQWGYGPLYAYEAIRQVLAVRHEAMTAIEANQETQP
jgi:hypothetical protein